MTLPWSTKYNPDTEPKVELEPIHCDKCDIQIGRITRGTFDLLDAMTDAEDGDPGTVLLCNRCNQ